MKNNKIRKQKKKIKINFKGLAQGLFIVVINLSVLGFFASLWVVFTRYFQEEILKLPVLFIIFYLFGGFIVLFNGLRINWSGIKIR